MAASTIQQQWKKRQASVKQRRFEEDRDRAVLDIQSALKGHLARKQMVAGSKLDQHKKQ